MRFLSDILAKAGLIVDGAAVFNSSATGQTPASNDNSTNFATTAWVRSFVQPYTLPIASSTVLGGIKVGTGLAIDALTGVLSVSGGSVSLKSTQTFTATEGQSIFTIVNGYTPGLIDVFLNGVYLSPGQTTATNGSTVTLADPAIAGDIIDVIITSPIGEGSIATTDSLPEGTVNLYYTPARVRTAISLTTTGVSGAATYDNLTGVFNIPNYQGLVPANGLAGQILAKASTTSYDTTWIDNYTSQVQHYVKLSVAMTAGTAVYVSGSTGGSGTNMIVSKASNASEGTSSKTLGLLKTGGAANDEVFVVTEGLLAGLDTSTANAGDPVWLGINGNLIFGLANKPTAPAHLVFIGVVTRVQSNNGEIFVKVQNGFELDELHDLSVKNASDGDMIKYVASTGLWTKIAASTTNIVEGTNLYYTDARVSAYLIANSYATQGYVNTAISNLVASAPTTLDTLNELATALGNDPNFATTIATSIGTKVPQTRTITINGTAYDLSADRSWSIAAGVTSFNTRTGAITLTSGDVTGALGYTPYNSTNPNGYITSSALSSYLPLTGGSLSGPLTITGNGSYLGDWGYNTLVLQDTSGYAGIAYKYGNNVWLQRRNTAGELDWAYSNDASSQGVGTYTQKMKLSSTEWWVSTYPGYKMRITGGDVIDALNGTSATPLYLQYQANTGGNVNIAASKFIFDNANNRLNFSKTSGTIISHGSMTDAIGYNASYGTYIGSPVGGTYYLYANGTLYDNGTVRTLLHNGNGIAFNGTSTRFTGDVNTLGLSSTTGVYNLGVASNAPSTYGTLMGFWNSDISTQLYLSYNGDAYWRPSISTSFSGAAWRTFIDSNNYTTYVPSKTGAGASGTWGINISGSASQFAGYSINNYEGDFGQTLDLSGLDSNTYYPVTIGVPTNRLVKLSIRVALNSNVPSWATHGAGFSVKFSWTVNGHGWGTTAVVRWIDSWTAGFYSGMNPIGGISQMGNSTQEVIWLRGGGVYYAYNSEPLGWTIRTSSYSIYGQTVAPSTTAVNNPWYQSEGPHSFGAVLSNGDLESLQGGIKTNGGNGYHVSFKPTTGATFNIGTSTGNLGITGPFINATYNGTSDTSSVPLYFNSHSFHVFCNYDQKMRIEPVYGDMHLRGYIYQGNTNWSDLRMKQNLQKITDPLTKISAINGYTFEWREWTGYRNTPEIMERINDAGLIAQEVEAVLPAIVETDVNRDQKSMNYNGVIALHTEGIKELIKQNQELLARVIELESRL